MHLCIHQHFGEKNPHCIKATKNCVEIPVKAFLKPTEVTEFVRKEVILPVSQVFVWELIHPRVPSLPWAGDAQGAAPPTPAPIAGTQPAQESHPPCQFLPCAVCCSIWPVCRDFFFPFAFMPWLLASRGAGEAASRSLRGGGGGGQRCVHHIERL